MAYEGQCTFKARACALNKTQRTQISSLWAEYADCAYIVEHIDELRFRSWISESGFKIIWFVVSNKDLTNSISSFSMQNADGQYFLNFLKFQKAKLKDLTIRKH